MRQNRSHTMSTARLTPSDTLDETQPLNTAPPAPRKEPPITVTLDSDTEGDRLLSEEDPTPSQSDEVFARSLDTAKRRYHDARDALDTIFFDYEFYKVFHLVNQAKIILKD